MKIYATLRAFKSGGNYYKPGDIIVNLASVKRVRSKLSEGKIIELDRGDKNTVPMLSRLELKYGGNFLANAKKYCAEVDGGLHEKYIETVRASNKRSAFTLDMIK